MVTKLGKDLTLGERVSNWAKAFSLIGAALLGFYGAFIRGEPEAQLAYKELAKAFNQLKMQVDKEHAFVSGFLAGLNQGSIKKEFGDEPAPKKPVAVKPVVAPTKTCKDGWVLVNGKCRKRLAKVLIKRPTSIKSAKPAPVQQDKKIFHYIKKNLGQWSIEQKTDALKLYKQAKKGDWDLARFINALMQAQKDRAKEKPLLPPTLTKLKQEQAQEQVQESKK